MLKTSNKLKILKIKKVCQISESHCGPAVLEMLLRYLGKRRTQKTITKYCRIKSTIKGHGARVDQLSRAIIKMYPSLRLWYKKNSRISEIKEIVQNYRYPVAVEWQGLFEIFEEETDDDLGHYAVVVGFDEIKEKIVLSDPYKHYCHKLRYLKVSRFVRRWWDINEIKTSEGKTRKIRDHRLFFLVLPEELDFPKKFGMKKFE